MWWIEDACKLFAIPHIKGWSFFPFFWIRACMWLALTNKMQQKCATPKVLVSQSCLTLYDPMDYSPSGFSVHGLSQARILEWVAISFSRGSSWPRDWTCVSWIAGRFLTIWATREATPKAVCQFQGWILQALQPPSSHTSEILTDAMLRIPSHMEMISKVLWTRTQASTNSQTWVSHFGCSSLSWAFRW